MDRRQADNRKLRRTCLAHKLCHSAIYHLVRVMPAHTNSDDDLETDHQAGREDMGILTEYLSGDILGSRAAAAQTPSFEGEAVVLTTEYTEDESDLETLLAQLDRADGMVTDVEDRLDKVLDKLDDLLIGLDSRDTAHRGTDDPANTTSAKS